MFIIKVTKLNDKTGTTLFGPFASEQEAEKVLKKSGWKKLVLRWWELGEYHAIIDKPIPVLVEDPEMLSQSL